MGWDSAPNLFHPFERAQKLFKENLVRREFCQPLGAGRFQIDRDTVGSLHGAINLVLFGAWHDL